MSTRRFVHSVTSREAGQRLDAIAAEWLHGALERPLSKSTVRRLIMSGTVLVNGRPSRRPGQLLGQGSRLEAGIDEERLAPRAEAPIPRVDVLYEDEWLVAVSKPPGLATHPTADPSRPDLYSLVRRQLSSPASTPYLGLHQRLDRDTSGVVLFARLPAANASLARQFEAHSIEKTYHALTVKPHGTVALRWRVSGSVEPAGKGRRSRTRSVEEGGVPARTDFAVLTDLGSALLVEARPVTGRKHQVRAHLAECGAPILGDERYGGPSRIGDTVVRRSMLHAYRLALRHPITSRLLRLECPYPADFEAVLAALGGGQLTRSGRSG